MERWRKTTLTKGEKAFRCVGALKSNRTWPRQVLKCLEHNAALLKRGEIEELPPALVDEVRAMLEDHIPRDMDGVAIFSDPRVWRRLALLYSEVLGVEMSARGRWRNELAPIQIRKM